MADFAAPAFLVTLARSVSVIMTNTKMIGTVLHAMEGLVSGASSVSFVLLTFFAACRSRSSSAAARPGRR